MSKLRFSQDFQAEFCEVFEAEVWSNLEAEHWSTYFRLNSGRFFEAGADIEDIEAYKFGKIRISEAGFCCCMDICSYFVERILPSSLLCL